MAGRQGPGRGKEQALAHTGPCAAGQVVTCEADGGHPGHTAPGGGCTPGDSEWMTVPSSAMRLCFLNLGPAKGARALWLTAWLRAPPRGHTRLVEPVRVACCPWCCCERPSRSGGGCGCPSVGVRPGPPPPPALVPHGGSGGPQCCVLSWTRISPGAMSWSCDGKGVPQAVCPSCCRPGLCVPLPVLCAAWGLRHAHRGQGPFKASTGQGRTQRRVCREPCALASLLPLSA